MRSMRPGLTLLLLLLLQASPDATWRDLLATSARDKRPAVVFFRSQDCPRCEELERVFVHHPAIERRLPAVVFAALPVDAGEAAALWKSSHSGIAYFDRSGALRARWPIVPDTMNFGIILDSIIAVDFEHALQLFEAGQPGEGEIALALGFARLGRNTDARAALERARAQGNPEIRQSVIVTAAVLDFKEGRHADALTQIQVVAANALTPKIAAEASKAMESIREAMGRRDPGRNSGVIRILPPDRQVVRGRQIVKTHVASANVARVAFSLDGREVPRRMQPPFSATLHFAEVPTRQTIRVVAFNRKGQEIGRDEHVVNEAGETFWLRILEPREGAAHGRVRVHVGIRAPLPVAFDASRFPGTMRSAES